MDGVSVPVVARLLGHADVKMTLRHVHLADKEIGGRQRKRVQRQLG